MRARTEVTTLGDTDVITALANFVIATSGEPEVPMTDMFAWTITRSPHPVDGLPPAPAADPALLEAPGFSIGSLALGLFLSGFNDYSIPSNLAGQLLIMIFCSAVLLITVIWSIPRGEGPLATVLGLFGAFWLSFSTLVFGLTNNWFGELSDKAQRGVQAIFLLIWLVAMVVLTFTTLRMPLVYTLLFTLVDVSLVTLFGAVTESRPSPVGVPTILLFGVAAIFAISIIGIYMFASAMNAATGGKPFPQDRPLLRR
jgi:succinate-acetate transporter protein